MLAGAGLSRAAPSKLPSSAELAHDAAAKYEVESPGALPPEARHDLEKLTHFFFERGLLTLTFLHRLVDWSRFRRPANAGHEALADLFAGRAIDLLLTTNVDFLLEDASTTIGGDLRSALNVTEAGLPGTRPFVKLHGCYVRQLPATLWCHAQLEEPDARRHLDEMGRWLETRLRGRDLLLLGFWTDWGYLNSALETCVSAAEPASVTLVALDDEATLKAKAPSLWEWASRRPNFKPVSMDAAEFLVELRRQFGLLFRRLLLETGRATAASHYGIPPTAHRQRPLRFSAGCLRGLTVVNSSDSPTGQQYGTAWSSSRKAPCVRCGTRRLRLRLLRKTRSCDKWSRAVAQSSARAGRGRRGAAR